MRLKQIFQIKNSFSKFQFHNQHKTIKIWHRQQIQELMVVSNNVLGSMHRMILKKMMSLKELPHKHPQLRSPFFFKLMYLKKFLTMIRNKSLDLVNNDLADCLTYKKVYILCFSYQTSAESIYKKLWNSMKEIRNQKYQPNLKL